MALYRGSGRDPDPDQISGKQLLQGKNTTCVEGTDKNFLRSSWTAVRQRTPVQTVPPPETLLLRWDGRSM